MNKFKYISICFVSIISILSMLSGCASNTPLLRRSETNLFLSNNKSINKVDKLKTRVLEISMRLNSVPNQTINRLLLKAADKIKREIEHHLNPYPIDHRSKSLVGNNYAIPINKTIKGANEKFELKIKSINIEKIFCVIDFSIENLSAYDVAYHLILTNRLNDKKKLTPFKSNLNGENYSKLNSLTRIDGSIIFLMMKDLSGMRFIVSIKTRKNKLYRLMYNF